MQITKELSTLLQVFTHFVSTSQTMSNLDAMGRFNTSQIVGENEYSVKSISNLWLLSNVK